MFEALRKILSGCAIDFVQNGAQERVMYIYQKDIENENFKLSLPDGKCIKVSFEYVDYPN